jgi:hypothetical protein
MCSLVGFPGGVAGAGSDDNLLRRMADTLHHRGPDDGGYSCDSEHRIGLGHSRLAIVDLSPARHQPIVSATGHLAHATGLERIVPIAGYFEEVDLLYRGKQLGWASVYFAGAHALHAEEGTSRQVKAKRLFYSLRSCLLYAFKHFSPFAAMAVLLTTLFVEPVSRSGLPIGRRSWLSFKETWVAYGMLFRWLPDWIFKGTTH